MPTLHDPVALTIGGLSIRWYALFILTGIVVAIAIIRVLALRRGMDPEFILDVAPWVVFGAIVGARLYYVALKWDFYRDNPGEAINIRLGGLTIHGALAAGVLLFYFFCRRRGDRFLPWADVVIAAVPIGQAIGRWGNWANQEAFGTPSDLPWAVTIDPDRRPAGYEQYATFHPTFLYEAVLDVGIAAFLIWLVLQMPRRRQLREGDALWSYFILYGVARLIVESARTDSLYIGPLKAAHWVSGALIVGGAVLLILRHTVWPGRPADPPGEIASPPSSLTIASTASAGDTT
ncbi:MAG: phosphatidylglycerol---prolipoprotein diacylglyceryl transferase [Thermomicrobiales bacterium]|nr:phosphatidylglycerol---prolipoprotein diacylglyceryl transferase [Thermomicrobiales bacterium]